MAGTYLVYPEATTSRNSLWQACSAFPASKKATVSRRKKAGEGTGTVRLIHLPVVKIDIPVRTAYNKAIAAAAPEMKMTAQRQKCRDSP